MIALAMVVLDVLGDRAPEMALAQRYDPIEAFLLDRPHEAFGVALRSALGPGWVARRRLRRSGSLRRQPIAGRSNQQPRHRLAEIREVVTCF